MMQRKRIVALSTLGVVLIAIVFICSWFRPEAVKERNLDFFKTSSCGIYKGAIS